MSERAASEIHAVNPDAKIIIMLRNPVDIAVSMHAQLLSQGDESERDFFKAYQLSRARQCGRRLPSGVAYPDDGLLYDKIGALGTQVGRYIDEFGSEQVHLVWFDEFISDPGKAVESVLRFLGLENVRPTHETKDWNPSTLPRSTFLATRLMHPSRPVRSLVRRLPLRGALLAARSRLLELNMRSTPRRSLHGWQRELVARHYADEVQRLSIVTGRALEDWLPSGDIGADPSVRGAPKTPAQVAGTTLVAAGSRGAPQAVELSTCSGRRSGALSGLKRATVTEADLEPRESLGARQDSLWSAADTEWMLFADTSMFSTVVLEQLRAAAAERPECAFVVGRRPGGRSANGGRRTRSVGLSDLLVGNWSASVVLVRSDVPLPFLPEADERDWPRLLTTSLLSGFQIAMASDVIVGTARSRGFRRLWSDTCVRRAAIGAMMRSPQTTLRELLSSFRW